MYNKSPTFSRALYFLLLNNQTHDKEEQSRFNNVSSHGERNPKNLIELSFHRRGIARRQHKRTKYHQQNRKYSFHCRFIHFLPPLLQPNNEPNDKRPDHGKRRELDDLDCGVHNRI